MITETSLTTDKTIRVSLREKLEKLYCNNSELKVIEELGINHGSVRADIAVVNGMMHGFEIKSDRDTLSRLPDQIKAYNSVFDKVTIVVGFSHVYEAINSVPDWWGIEVAKTNQRHSVIFNQIREPQSNPERDELSIARLLWREEALRLLEELDEAQGYYSKPRRIIYEKLAIALDIDTLAGKVRETLFLRDSQRFA